MAWIQTLIDAARRVVARWASACAERVVVLFDADASAEPEIRGAVARTRACAAGESPCETTSGTDGSDG